MRTPSQIASDMMASFTICDGDVEECSKGYVEDVIAQAVREAQREVDASLFTLNELRAAYEAQLAKGEPQFAPGEEFDYYRDEYYDLLNWGEPIDPESPFGRVRLTSQVGETKNLTVTTGQSYHILAYLSEQNRPLKEQEETEQL